MEPFPTHLTGTVPGGLGLPCEGTAGSSPSSRGLEVCWSQQGPSEPAGFNVKWCQLAAVHMEPFSTHPAATPGGPGATLWGHSRQQPLQGRSQGVLGACGGSLSPQDSTHMVGAGGSCTHGTFLHLHYFHLFRLCAG